MFEYDGNEYTLEELQVSAGNQGLDFETFMTRMKSAGMVEKQTGSAKKNPVAGSKNMDYKSVDGSSVFQYKEEGGKKAWSRTYDGGENYEVVDANNIPKAWFDDKQFQEAYDQNLQKAKEVKEVEEISGGTELISNLGLGFAETFQGATSFGERMQLGLYELFTPGELTPAEKEGVLVGIRSMSTLSSTTFDPIINILQQNIPEYETATITEELKNGDYGTAGWRAVNAAVRSMPSLVGAALGPGGIIIIGASAAGNKIEEEYELDPEKSTGILLANGIVTGATEAAFELVTRGLLKKAWLAG
jgi:hypothetical protein